MVFFSNKLLLNIMACVWILSSPLLGVSNGVATSKQNNKNAISWKLFTFAKDGFSIDLPRDPELIEQSIDIPKTDLKITYTTYLSEPSDKAVYVVSVWNYPKELDMSKPEVNLNDGFNGMLSALPGTKILNMNMGDEQGFKSLEFLVQNDDIYFQGKLVLVYNTLYQVFTVYKEQEDMKANYNHFIGSFKLINPAKRQVVPERKNGQALNGANGKKMNV